VPLQPPYPPNGRVPGGSSDGELAKNITAFAGSDAARPSRPIEPRGYTQSSVDIQRLTSALTYSDQKLRPFRERYAEAVKLFAGHRYGGADSEKSPLNLIRLAVDIWTRQLISQTPRALVLTRGLNTKTEAYELAIALNHTADVLELGQVLADVVQSAIFSLGVIKIGLTPAYLSRRAGFHTATGQLFAEQVLFEDFIVDMNAKTWKEVSYIGNTYRAPLDSVLENTNFDGEARRQIDQHAQRLLVPQEERTSTMSGGEDGLLRDSDFHRMTELMDIYLPVEKLVVTLSGQQPTRALKVVKVKSPETGPYRVLQFSRVPGNVIPSAPAQHLCEMQIVITRLFNQLVNQAWRAKTVTVADGKTVADGSAARVADSIDGAVIRVSHPDGIKSITYDGADPQNMKFVGWAKDLFSYLGGNLDTMGGLAAGSRTIGQDELMSQSSSEQLRDMQSKVLKFNKEVFEDLGELLYTDPTLRLRLQKNIEGIGDVPFVWTSDKRRGEFFDYNFDVVPFSGTSQSPQQRIEAISSLFSKFILPLEAQMTANGERVNTAKLMEILSTYGNWPELLDIIQTQEPRRGEQIVGPPIARRPLQQPNTTRTYVTENQSGTKSTAEEAIMAAPGAAGERSQHNK